MPTKTGINIRLLSCYCASIIRLEVYKIHHMHNRYWRFYKFTIKSLFLTWDYISWYFLSSCHLEYSCYWCKQINVWCIQCTLHTAVFDDVPASLFSLSYIARSLTDKLGCSAGDLYTTNMKINDHSTPKLPEIKWKKIVKSNVPGKFVYCLQSD